MARPILRPAPVTMATRPVRTCSVMARLSLQRLQIDGPAVELRQQGQCRRTALRIPPAVAGIERELFLEIGAREGLVRAAAEMRLTFFDHAAVVEHGANV